MNYEQERQDLARAYNEFSQHHDNERNQYFDNLEEFNMLSGLLEKRSRVLDAGCGTGYPVVKFFHDLGHYVTGTDIAEEALGYVKIHAPGAETKVCDTSELDFPENTFDLITSFYSFMHLPLDRQIVAFEKFYKMIKPGCNIYVTLACEEYTGKPQFSGRKMYLGYPLPIYHFTKEKYFDILDKIGFKDISFEKKDIGKDTVLLWVRAIK